MSYDIKLRVFTLRLKKYRAKKNPELSWKDLFDKFNGEEEEKFNYFFKKYVESFDGKFIQYPNWPKAIMIGNNKLKLKFKSKERIFYAEFEGGNTNQTFNIKKLNNPEDGIQVKKDQVTSQPFHLIFHIPENSNIGLLIVQSFGETSMHDLIKLNFNNYIKSIDSQFVVDFTEQIPKEAVELVKRGAIKSVSIRQSGLSKDKGDRIFKKHYNDYSDIKVELKISFPDRVKNAKFIDDFTKKVLGNNPDLFELKTLDNIGIDNTSEIFVKFEYNKRETTAKLDKGFNFTPTYIVQPKDVPLNADNHPDSLKMKTYLEDFMQNMLKEIGLKS